MIIVNFATEQPKSFPKIMQQDNYFVLVFDYDPKTKMYPYFDLSHPESPKLRYMKNIDGLVESNKTITLKNHKP